MKIYSASQVHAWDQYTITHEPVSSIGLMERAAKASVDWLMENGYRDRSFSVFCGPGNNGGDGLAIARLLIGSGHAVTIYLFESDKPGSTDYEANLLRLGRLPAIRMIGIDFNLQLPDNEVIIDAIFGSGLNKLVSGIFAETIAAINDAKAAVISIDIPSGMSADQSSKNGMRIRATHTLSFETWKLAFMMSENEKACGKIHILGIGLHEDFLHQEGSVFSVTGKPEIAGIYKPRDSFAHKGTFGHSLVIAGSYGKIGAALLCTRACLRAGSGLVTTHIPRCGYIIIQSSAPEAMTETDDHDRFITGVATDHSKYAAIAIGPGIGQENQTLQVLEQVISSFGRPMVIDADALNMLGANPALLQKLPPGTILTPHPKEFERLFGETANDFDKAALALQKAKEYKIVIVLKGHRTLVATPLGGFYNSTGNAGMASGGTGDSLTGILTALLAQKYEPGEAAILGVYLHGLAGDHAAAKIGQEALTAGDLIENIGAGFLDIARKGH